jgi:hypothetical protein
VCGSKLRVQNIDSEASHKMPIGIETFLSVKGNMLLFIRKSSTLPRNTMG